MTRQGNNPFRQWVRLEQPRLGTRVVYATDDFFADKARLIDPAEPVFIPDKYDDHGKWMDGWESRRKRTPGHDFCVIRLGIPGRIHGVDIDTRYFTGNYPPRASIDACVSNAEIPENGWEPLLPATDLQGNSQHLLP
jgi:allantoicase